MVNILLLWVVSGTIIEFNNPANWQQREVPTSVLLTAIHAVDDEHIWVGRARWCFYCKVPMADKAGRCVLDGHQLLALEYEWLQERQIELEDAIENAGRRIRKQKNWSLSSTSCFSILAVAEIQF